MKNILLSAFTIMAILGCTSKKGTPENKLTLTMEPKSGSAVMGTAIFSQSGSTVTLTANLKNLEPGVHAIHIHEKADCSAADATSAGGHWNPTFKKHGKWGVGEYHKGDIGNFTANASGNATINFSTDEWCIGCDDETKNIVGKSLMVHQKADDFTTQPTGDAGSRLACGAIIR